MISVIGGTGKIGFGLVMRFALADEELAIGSRNLEKAARAVEKVRAAVPGARVIAMENQEAVSKGDILFLTIPYSAQKSTLKFLGRVLEDKILVSMVNPFRRINGEFRSIPIEEGSAAEEAQKALPMVKVISAFKNISSEMFLDVGKPLSCDTVVCSNYEGPKRKVMDLARKLGIKPLDGGKLRNSRHLDAITVLLLNLNSRYKASTCFKIDGL
ncbi:MAG: NADPH-dependent F420 reductase [Candidatus Hydrothermarchaeota archaeon]|nr:NADPH-dependent F420 reductase [Candidatus Hydrothermarchaeota archaeon]